MMAFKRMACLVLVFMLMSTMIAASAYAPYEKLHVTNCNAWVSLREEPSTSSKRIVQLPLGVLVSFVDENGDFLKVSYSGTMGYVGREYLKATDDVRLRADVCRELQRMGQPAGGGNDRTPRALRKSHWGRGCFPRGRAGGYRTLWRG